MVSRDPGMESRFAAVIWFPGASHIRPRGDRRLRTSAARCVDHTYQKPRPVSPVRDLTRDQRYDAYNHDILSSTKGVTLMKIGVFTVLFAQRPFEEALDFIKETGCEAVEIGTGGHPGGAHCDLDALVDNDAAQKEWMDKITSRGLEVSALSCHGNPIHPDAETAKREDETFRKTIRLASQLGIQNVINFS